MARISQIPGIIRAVIAILGGKPPAPVWPPPFPGTVKLQDPLMRGSHVAQWQSGLINWAKLPITGGADGVWGLASNHQLIQFQKRVAVAPDGVGGPVTWSKLAPLAPKPVTPKPPAPPTPTPTGDDMLFLVQVTGRPTLYLTNWLTARVVTQEDVNVAQWISTSAKHPVATAGFPAAPTGKPYMLGTDQADVIDRLLAQS